MVSAEVTVGVDGTPARLGVHLANTSTTVDGYVVEAVDAPPGFTVEPGGLELLPGTQGIAEVVVRIDPPTLFPAQHVPLLLRVRNLTGKQAFRELLTGVTVPVVDAAVTVRVEPQLIRMHGHSSGRCAVVVDNSASNRWKEVQLSAADPEHVVQASWLSPRLEVPPAGEARTEVRFAAPPPEPGGELTRAVTVTATDGQARVTTTVTLVQSVARAPIELLDLRLDPTLLRLGSRRRGDLTAVVDNRRGTDTALVSLQGDDPENCLEFVLSSSAVTVQPGAVASVRVTVTAPRTPPGRETTRPFSVVASDGHRDIRADGSVVQLAPSRRWLARVLLTLLGGLAMSAGALLPFAASESQDAAITMTAARVADIAANRGLGDVTDHVRASGLGDVVSLGLVVIVCGALMVFGLTGRSGRLSRFAAFLGAAVVVASLVALGLLESRYVGPAEGGLVILAGCVAGYVGGLVGRR